MVIVMIILMMVGMMVLITKNAIDSNNCIGRLVVVIFNDGSIIMMTGDTHLV